MFVDDGVDDGDDEFSFAIVSVWCADLGMDFGLFAPERRSRAPVTAAALGPLAVHHHSFIFLNASFLF